MSEQSTNINSLVGVIAAISAALASTLCCIGPLIYLMFGVSAAWLVDIPGAEILQIPMLILSIGLMLCVFWRLHISQKPICVNIISRRTLVILYWLAVPLVGFLLSYPYLLPWIWGMES